MIDGKTFYEILEVEPSSSLKQSKRHIENSAFYIIWTKIMERQ